MHYYIKKKKLFILLKINMFSSQKQIENEQFGANLRRPYIKDMRTLITDGKEARMRITIGC